eukprot:TRINITY_DN47025_c0_g1_i1.p1 TRINITY_DN47025_c0_g1~~TRINITY_DN47025_c0_g1_i1.p1  ORF type:complete len:194 (+),score=19.76 TRINITY_DN47025_c0_g1_i1:84-584(+)
MAGRRFLFPFLFLLSSTLVLLQPGGAGFIGVCIATKRIASRITMFGVTKEVWKPGDGKTFPQKGDKVTMHYTGKLANGVKFDSSLDRNQPFVTQIGTGKVIRGWDEGVPTMSLGEKATLRISPDYGYGSQGAGGVIPPNAELIFDVDLLKIESWNPLDMMKDVILR